MDTQKVIWHAAKKTLGPVLKSKSTSSWCDADESEDVVPANTQKANSEVQISTEQRTLDEFKIGIIMISLVTATERRQKELFGQHL